MDMQGQRQLFVTQQQAWEALNNPDMLKACIPGCDKFEVTEDNVYNVGVAIKIGPVSAKFTGKPCASIGARASVSPARAKAKAICCNSA